MQLWPVAHFFSFCHHFWVGLLLLCCCTHPKVMKKWKKKWAIGQSCIPKELTSYKIHTLDAYVVSCPSWIKNLEWYLSVCSIVYTAVQNSNSDIRTLWQGSAGAAFTHTYIQLLDVACGVLKVSKSQNQFFLKLHCPKNEQNNRQNSALWS
jgi:hypothetical protein